MTARIQAKTVSGELWTLATIRMSREILDGRGYEMKRGFDDLDSFTVFELFDESIGHLYLLNRDHVPAGHFDVMVDASISRDNALQALHRLFTADERDYEWISSVAEYSVPRPAADDPSDNFRDANAGQVTNIRSAQRDADSSGRFRKPA